MWLYGHMSLYNHSTCTIFAVYTLCTIYDSSICMYLNDLHFSITNGAVYNQRSHTMCESECAFKESQRLDLPGLEWEKIYYFNIIIYLFFTK